VDLGLKGARALVGGASAGLGAACAEALAAEGAAVVVTARRADALGEVADRVGGTAVVGDLSTHDGPAGVVESAVAQLGGLDVLIVNSGGPAAGNFADVSPETWEAATQTTLLGPIRLIAAALPHLQGSDRASITMVLGSTVRVPLPRIVTSNVLRPALAGLVKSLAGELAPGVRVNGLAPGRIHTERADELDARWSELSGEPFDEVRARAVANIPFGRYGRPEEFGRVAAFLASPAASYVSGQILPVDGAMTRSLP
jgi:3-oxoacyl-[acyl-carrier protein] reductase